MVLTARKLLLELDKVDMARMREEKVSAGNAI